MKQLLEQYAAYNLWANNRVIKTVDHLSEEQIHKEIISSFPSVYKTLIHLMEVENVWWERLQLIEKTTPPGWFTGNFEELSKKWLELSQQWENWVQNANDANINHVFSWNTIKKEYFKEPVYKMLFHLFNHQTLHRGQLITMFRQLKVDKIPSTDFLLFNRGK